VATRVLVVDDDLSSVIALRALLELDGFDATAVDSPQLALELLGTRPFDAVVTDLEMPGVSGLEVIRVACAGRHNSSVFVVTGCTEFSARSAALEGGARRIFDKPLDYEVLAHELNSLCTGRARAPSLRPVEKGRES